MWFLRALNEFQPHLWKCFNVICTELEDLKKKKKFRLVNLDLNILEESSDFTFNPFKLIWGRGFSFPKIWIQISKKLRDRFRS